MKVFLNGLAIVHGLLERAINLGTVIVAPGSDLLLAIFDQLDLPPVSLHEQLVRIAIVLDDHP